ncbi:hypothetical protein ACFCX0_03765 [Streptomyces sp. NPDC056352]|uniref:hypothetical protein n=1 Tax=Streptomyces sp. NPDC056352 TaxID=3345791 RepID=UPI0035DFA851
MTNLDALLAGGQVLVANHTVVDRLINTGLYYGPGVVLTVAAIAAGRGFFWAADRTHQLIDNRVARRQYAATATRLHTVANAADTVIAQAGDQLAERLRQQIYANDTHEGE